MSTYIAEREESAVIPEGMLLAKHLWGDVPPFMCVCVYRNRGRAFNVHHHTRARGQTIVYIGFRLLDLCLWKSKWQLGRSAMRWDGPFYFFFFIHKLLSIAVFWYIYSYIMDLCWCGLSACKLRPARVLVCWTFFIFFFWAAAHSTQLVFLNLYMFIIFN